MRDNLVNAALSWVGTPYHHGACVKGAGCDCATLVYAVLRECGLIEQEDIGHYGPDWFAHTGEEVYMRRVLRHAYKTAEGISYATLDAKPGCIVLTKHSTSSRVYNHAGIVIKWPMIVHAIHPKVAQVDASKHGMWAFHEVAVLDPVAKLEMELEHIS